MLVLDVNTFFGTLPSRRSDYGLPTLLGQLERHGIAAALTYSLRGLYDDHAVGNAETLAACRANTALLPVATINPLRGSPAMGAPSWHTSRPHGFLERDIGIDRREC